MPPILLTALDTSPGWATVGSLATLLAALIAFFALLFTRQGLRNAREQDLASRVDSLLATLGTGEIVEARDSIYGLAVSTPKEQPVELLDPVARQQVFKLLWALQRVSVLSPVIKRSGDASVRVLQDQVSRIVDALTRLGKKLDDSDKNDMKESIATTVLALSSFEEEIARKQLAKKCKKPANEGPWSRRLQRDLSPLAVQGGFLTRPAYRSSTLMI